MANICNQIQNDMSNLHQLFFVRWVNAKSIPLFIQLLVKRTTVLEQARNELKRIGDLSQQHKKIENKQEDIRNEIQAQSRSLKDGKQINSK